MNVLQVNLVEWLKAMVGSRKSEEVVDPKLPEMPSSKALKRILLVALRCVDPDAQKRPKMGHVIHMLEADDLLFRDVCFISKYCQEKNIQNKDLLLLRSLPLIHLSFLLSICRKDELGVPIMVIVRERIAMLQN